MGGGVRAYLGTKKCILWQIQTFIVLREIMSSIVAKLGPDVQVCPDCDVCDLLICRLREQRCLSFTTDIQCMCPALSYIEILCKMRLFYIR